MRFSVVLALALVAILATPALASAYTTHISTPGPGPAGVNYLTINRDTGGMLDIAGTTDLADTDTVDIRCYYSDTYVEIGDDIPISGGTFSYTYDHSVMFVSAFLQRICFLRAVLHDDATPIDLTSQTGPLVSTGIYQYDEYRINGGPNSGEHYDFYASQAGLRAVSEVVSIGNCGLYDTYAVDETLVVSYPLFYCDAYFEYTDDVADPPGTRALLRVDGRNAYFAYDFVQQQLGSNGEDTPGLPSLEFTRTQDPVTGNVVVQDNEGVAFCTDATCDAAVDAGIEINRTVQVDHAGQQQTITDVIRSTDGREHSFDGIFANELSGETAGWRFPGEATFSAHVRGDTIPVTDAVPQSILVKQEVGDTQEAVCCPRGAITMGAKPDSYRFLSPDALQGYSSVGIGYVRTVPATGALVFKHVYSTTLKQTTLDALRADAEDRAAAPTLTIESPVNGSRVATPSIVARGRAMDVGGVTALTVNGAPVGIASDGSWSSTIALREGSNTISALAVDRYGNTATAAVTVVLATTLATTGVDLVSPAISRTALSRTKFRVGSASTPLAARTQAGTKVSYTLSEAATVTFGVSRQLKGRRVGKKCRTATRRLRKRKSCPRLKSAGTLRRAASAGPQSLSFSGRIGKKALKPGRYRMLLQATDKAGNRSKAVTLTFRIVRR